MKNERLYKIRQILTYNEKRFRTNKTVRFQTELRPHMITVEDGVVILHCNEDINTFRLDESRNEVYITTI